jgi:hypothetical protein
VITDFYLAVVGFELNALNSTTWAMSPALHALGIFLIDSDAYAQASWILISCYGSQVAGMTGMHQHTQVFFISI